MKDNEPLYPHQSFHSRPHPRRFESYTFGVFSPARSEGMPLWGPVPEGTAIVRMPPTWSTRFAADNVFFTSDIAVGLNFTIRAAQVHDQWTWRYYDPSGSLYSGSCFIEVRGPGEEGNDSILSGVDHQLRHKPRNRVGNP